MKRILLITEDFNEMTFLETLLKKLGFDTIGIQSGLTAQDKAMAINPEMVIISDFIKGQSTHALLESLVSYRPNIFVILMKTNINEQTQHVSEFVNKIVKSPVDPIEFIQSVCEVAKLNTEQYLEKFYKLGLFKGARDVEPITVSGKIKPVSDTQYIKKLNNSLSEKNSKERKKRYQEQIQSLSQPKALGIDNKKAAKEVQEFRQRSEDTEIKKIDEQRKNFVKALFKK